MQINPNPLGTSNGLFQVFQSVARPEARPAEQAAVGRPETETAVSATQEQERPAPGAGEGRTFPRGSIVDVRA